MSSLEGPITAEPLAERDAPGTRFEAFEALLARLSDRLNPILVKEARQALRSRQFTTTFMLMLAAGWAWSIMGLAMMGPAAYYNAEGPSMFYVYYVILAAPLLIVIPYGAFQSLSTERQDRTYELVSITALGARQILAGKLCGAGLQMMVYLSALFPCLAFTYLLRGLDIFSVFMVVAYTCLLSLGLAMIGLLMATLSDSKQRQIAQGVGLVVLLVYAFGGTVTTMSFLVAGERVRVDDVVFWQLNLFLATLYVDLFALVFLSARALLTTVCQNRSTALRIALVAAQLSMIAWATWGVIRLEDDIVYGLIAGSTMYWFLVGSLMVGESQELSPRVKRGLPDSGLARVLLRAFAPGPGTGYLFVVANMIAMTTAAVAIAASGLNDFAPLFHRVQSGAGNPNHVFDVFVAGLFATCYVAIYLGLAKLVLGTIARFAQLKLPARVLVAILLLFTGAGIPWVVQITNPATRNLDYTLWQISNPVWTLWECCVEGPLPGGDVFALMLALPVAALAVWLANVPSLAAELGQVRVSKPPRVAEDDAALAPPAPEPGRTNPWDD